MDCNETTSAQSTGNTQMPTDVGDYLRAELEQVQREIAELRLEIAEMESYRTH